jgi:hypothetical protein
MTTEHEANRREPRQPERQTGAQHGRQRQSSQVVRIDAGGHSRRQKLKSSALGRRQHADDDAVRIFE